MWHTQPDSQTAPLVAGGPTGSINALVLSPPVGTTVAAAAAETEALLETKTMHAVHYVGYLSAPGVKQIELKLNGVCGGKQCTVAWVSFHRQHHATQLT